MWRDELDGGTITLADLIMSHAHLLLKDTEAGKKKVRLLGLTISNFENHLGKYQRYKQLSLPFGI